MSLTPRYPPGRDTDMSEVAEDDPELALGESPCAQRFVFFGCLAWLNACMYHILHLDDKCSE